MEPWFMSAISVAIGSLTTAIVYLFKENKRLLESESKCQSSLATIRAELVSINALVQQMQWSGANQIDAVVVADMSTGMIIEWNPGATILLHWTEREMLGKQIHRIIPQRYKDKHDEAVRAFSRGTDSPTRGPIYAHALTKDGLEIAVEITFSGWRVGKVPIVAATIHRRLESYENATEPLKNPT